jgi:hypothetical protein
MKNTSGNSTFAIDGISCSAGSFVVTECAVLRINFCAEKPAHRKSANRLWASIKTKTVCASQRVDYPM